MVIKRIVTEDRRYPLKDGEGSDSVHNAGMYGMAVCKLKTESNTEGVGYVLTMGAGNDLVCKCIEYLAEPLVGREICELMSSFNDVWSRIADQPAFRWLGPHKGIVHLALAAITNACFDLWAKRMGVPLWKLLINLSPEEIINLLEFRYIEDYLTRGEALDILKAAQQSRNDRMRILKTGYTGYDTSVGWFDFPDEKVVMNAKAAVDNGFKAMKIKVGSKDKERDIRRLKMLRDAVGEDVTIMIDANQQWTLQQALSIIPRLKEMNPYWVEEPTDPDDIRAHQTLAQAIWPTKVALGEHVPNKVLFKNYLQAGAMAINQVDAARVGGISEFILISLMSKKAGVPVIPHVGDMGHIHQHMVFFNHISIAHPALFLEYIPHLECYFTTKVAFKDGKYMPPQVPGSSSEMVAM